jgi:hypothetical protein
MSIDMTNERMTDLQIHATVAAMKMPLKHKMALIEQACAGNASARFVIFAEWRRQQTGATRGEA